MTDLTIECPKCNEIFALSDTLAAPILEENKKHFEAQLKAETERIRAEVSEAAKLQSEQQNSAIRYELKLLKANKIMQDQKLTEAQAAQAEYLKKELALENARREIDLTVQKKVQEESQTLRLKAKSDAELEFQLTIQSLNQTIERLTGDLAQAQRRAEQGSQQQQGEVLEVHLENQLKHHFPFDVFQPIPKGQSGADIVQMVRTELATESGKMIWEFKNTKNWGNDWINKLKADQRTVHADTAILVTVSLPSDIQTFGLKEGVWVTNIQNALPLAIALRHTLLEVAKTKLTNQGIATKTEQVYQYLIGPQFKHRVEAIVEAFTVMKSDLDAEKRAIMKQWAKRESQIGLVMQNTIGMYGDLHGIAGQSLPAIANLEFEALGSNEEQVS